ncbi:MAG: hypothetical protein D6702_01985 [Planctomycetota bacterium]|nr:MAG: hypothetical protein D6702_01985 [Planctomycetota bacterium]
MPAMFVRASPIAIALLLPAACAGAPEQQAATNEVGAEAVPAADETPPEPAPLPGSEFLPAPLRPDDPSLAPSAAVRGALTMLAEGEPRPAAVALEAERRARGGNEQLAALQGWALTLAGEAGDAVRLLRPLAEDGGRQVRYALARALFAAGDRAAAHRWFAGCRDSAGAGAAADFLPWSAEAALAAGEAEAALRQLEPLLLEGPLEPRLALVRARALARLDRTAEALTCYEELLQGPEALEPARWNEAGMVAFRAALAGGAAEDFARARRFFAEAARLDPQEARFRFNLACACDWGGDPERAEAAYRRALELRPGYLEAYENLVLLLRAQGRGRDARRLQEEMLRQPLTPLELDRVYAVFDQPLPEAEVGASEAGVDSERRPSLDAAGRGQAGGGGGAAGQAADDDRL